ncbi:MAG: hypothetical protein KAI47_07485 [Deltaproteobacteria bacterium]|nr:hypothetical protein [Deltaproteobacteria bacterium]
MSALDDLLSPERLRGHWQQKVTAEPQATAPQLAPLERLGEEVEEICVERFALEGDAPLRQLCQRLRNLLDLSTKSESAKSEPDGEGAKSEPDGDAALADEILEVVTQIEDLAYALALAKRSH